MTRATFIFALTGVLLLRYYGFAEAPQLPEAQLVELDVTEAHPDLLAFLNNRPYKELVLEAAVRYELHPRLIDAVIQTESAYDPLAVSHKGALGLMQLMPATAQRLGVHRPLDPRQNVLGGARHLRSLLDTFNGNVTLALAAYNAGETAVLRHRGPPPYSETTQYLTRIADILSAGSLWRLRTVFAREPQQRPAPAPTAEVCIKTWHPETDYRGPTIGLECITSEEMDWQIDKLIRELEQVKRAAHLKFHEIRERSARNP